MRTKNGKIYLDKGEVRIGNYFVKEEKEHVRVADLNAVFSLRIRKDTAAGMFIAMCLTDPFRGDAAYKDGMNAYFSVLFSILGTVPDVAFLEAAYGEVEACMKRHPDAYGYPDTDAITDAMQADAEKEYKELRDFEEEVMNLPE